MQGGRRAGSGPPRSSLTPPPPLTLFFIDQCQCHSSRGRPRTLPSCSCSWNPTPSFAVVSGSASCFTAVHCCGPTHTHPLSLTLTRQPSLLLLHPLPWSAAAPCVAQLAPRVYVTRCLCLVTCALNARAMLMTLNILSILLSLANG